MTTGSQTIEITAGEVAAELKRRGIACDERVMVRIETANSFRAAAPHARRKAISGLTEGDG